MLHRCLFSTFTSYQIDSRGVGIKKKKEGICKMRNYISMHLCLVLSLNTPRCEDLVHHLIVMMGALICNKCALYSAILKVHQCQQIC